MIIALMALALAMILGGLLTVFLGWDIVLVERGWTMVIAGSISAASGALLLGITAAVSKLANIQAELARVQGGFEAEEPNASGASTGLSLAALSGGLLGGRALKADARTADEELEPLLPFEDERRDEAQVEDDEPAARPEVARSSESVIPFARKTTPESAPSRDEEPDIKVPDFLLADRLRDTYLEDRIPDADKSLFAAEPESEDREKERGASDNREEGVTPAVWPEAPAEPEPATEPEESETVPEEAQSATVIGTYNSGDNKYVMFSDGSIEAQTPKGVFRFKSLDELKEFIASGGEGGSAAAI